MKYLKSLTTYHLPFPVRSLFSAFVFALWIFCFGTGSLILSAADSSGQNSQATTASNGSNDGTQGNSIDDTNSGQASAEIESQGVTGSTINSMQALEHQAIANRELANRLYTQALKDESDAWDSFPPSVKLLTRSLEVSRQGNLADKQAMTSARAALGSINSGDSSATLDISKNFGQLDRDKINEIASAPSGLWSTVKSTLGAYGIEATALGYEVKTPYGEFSINPGVNDPNNLKAILDSRKSDFPFLSQLDAVAEAVSAGAQSAKSFVTQQASEVDQAVKSNLQKILNGIGGTKGLAIGSAGITGLNKNAANLGAEGSGEGKGVGKGETGGGPKSVESMALFGRKLSGVSDRNGTQKKAPSRDFFKRGSEDQDIFKMVQRQYLSQQKQGSFF